MIVAPLRFTVDPVPDDRMVPAPELLMVVPRASVPPAVASSVPVFPTGALVLIVKALEHLPDDAVELAVLLSPAISPRSGSRSAT